MMQNGLKIAVFFAVAAISTSCTSGKYAVLDSEDHRTVIQHDQYKIKKSSFENLPETLTYEEAVQRALDKNLDASVAALEALIAKDNVSIQSFNALPTLRGSASFNERSNEAASSSESVITRTQSLEPSTSSETARRLASLDFQWNLIDSVIAFLDARVAKESERISLERLRKVRHNIERDVTVAYWKSFAYANSENELDHIEHSIASILGNIEKAQAQRLLDIDDSTRRLSQLVTKKQSISQLEEEVKLSEMELKTLTSLPLECKIKLAGNPVDFEQKHPDIFNTDINALIDIALQERPEIRESLSNKNASVQSVKQEVIKSIPGLELLYSYNYDSNRFLVDNNWSDINASITQSVISILTLPKRYKAAKNRQALADAQRLALTAAIIAQTHIAKLRIDIAKNNFQDAYMLYKNARIKAISDTQRRFEGTVSGYDKTVSNAELVIQQIRKDLAYAELQRAYADMIGSLGRPLLTSSKGKEVSDV